MPYKDARQQMYKSLRKLNECLEESEFGPYRELGCMIGGLSPEEKERFEDIFAKLYAIVFRDGNKYQNKLEEIARINFPSLQIHELTSAKQELIQKIQNRPVIIKEPEVRNSKPRVIGKIKRTRRYGN